MADIVPFHDAWEGVMLEYTEQDFPTTKPYLRRVPGWKCLACGQRYGTAGYPPQACRCGQRSARPDEEDSDG
jgi:hypothetical protein